MKITTFKLNQLEGTQYIEVCNKLNKPCWNDDSLYFHDDIFDYMFSPVFYKVTNKKYSLFSFNELNTVEKNTLYLELQENQIIINGIKNLAELLTYANRKGTEYQHNDEILENHNLEDVLIAMQNINRALTSYVEQTISKKSSLWILGL